MKQTLIKGDRLSVRVVDVHEKGLGVSKVDGFTLFVEGAGLGEYHLVEVVKVGERFGFARSVKRLFDKNEVE